MKHVDSVQDAVHIARLFDKAAEYDRASKILREAWSAYRSLLGDQTRFTLDSASIADLILEKAGGGEHVAEVYEWMCKSR